MPEQGFVQVYKDGLKTKHVLGGLLHHDIRSLDAEGFLKGLREDKLPDDFSLSNEAFCELAERLNGGDRELAKELCGKGMIALLAAKKGTGVDGLLVLAEACKEG